MVVSGDANYNARGRHLFPIQDSHRRDIRLASRQSNSRAKTKTRESQPKQSIHPFFSPAQRSEGIDEASGGLSSDDAGRPVARPEKPLYPSGAELTDAGVFATATKLMDTQAQAQRAHAARLPLVGTMAAPDRRH